MLQIMERPLISKQTSHNPARIQQNSSILNKSRSVSRNSSLRGLNRSGSQNSVRNSDRNTPTTSGFGHATLNKQFRNKSAKEIQNQNLKMVNHLLNVKPNVPLATDLK